MVRCGNNLYVVRLAFFNLGFAIHPLVDPYVMCIFFFSPGVFSSKTQVKDQRLMALKKKEKSPFDHSVLYTILLFIYTYLYQIDKKILHPEKHLVITRFINRIFWCSAFHVSI
jgi:hypothetical protein